MGPADQAGLTKWDALLPTDSSLSMCAAVDALAAQYRAGNPELTVAQSRADALTDLVLSDVQVTTTATLIVPTSHAPTADPADPADPAAPPTRRDRRPANLNPGPTGVRAEPIPDRPGLRRYERPGGDQAAHRSPASDRRRAVRCVAQVDPAAGLLLCRPVPLVDRPAGPVERVAGRAVGPGLARPAAAGPVLEDRCARERGRRQPAPGPRLVRPGLVRAQAGHRLRRSGLLLPAQVTRSWPTRTPSSASVRPTRTPAPSTPRRADLPARGRPGPAGPRPGRHLPASRLRHPRRTVRPGPRDRLPHGPTTQRTYRAFAEPITGSNTTAAGPSP